MSIHEGALLKKLIKRKDLTFKAAAEILKIERSTLYYNLDKETMSPEFKSLVRQKLDIDLSDDAGGLELEMEFDANALHEELLLQKAITRTLTQAFAKLASKVTGQKVEDVLEEIDLDTRVNVRELMKKKS